MAQEIKTKEQYNQYLEQVRMNQDEMSEEELEQAVSVLSDAAQRLTAEAAAEVQRQEQVALQERPLASTGELPQEGGIGNFDDSRRVFGQLMKQGLIESYQGIKQFGQRIANAVNEGVFRRPNIEGKMELAQMQLDYAKAQDKWKAEFAADAKAVQMDPDWALAIPTLTQVGAEVAALGGPLSRVPTTFRRIAAEGGTAAVAGAIQPTATDEEFWANTLVSGAVGTGAGTVFWASQVPANARRRTLKTGRSGVLESLPFTHSPDVGLGSDAALEHEILARHFHPDLRLSAAQLSQSDALKGMERSAPGSPGSPRQQFARRQEDVFLNGYSEIINKLNPDNLDFTTFVSVARQQLTKRRDALSGQRKQQWNDTMDKAVEVAGGRTVKEGLNTRRVGDIPLVEANTFFDTLNSLYEEALSKGLNPEAEQALTRFYNRWAKSIDPQSGRMRPSKVQQLLVELTEEAGGNGAVLGDALKGNAKHWANTLKSATLADIDSTVAKGDELKQLFERQLSSGAKPRVRPDDLASQKAAETASLLKKAREDYQVASAGIEEFQSKALWRTLENMDSSSEGWYDRVMRLPPRDMKEFLSLADEAQPGLANAIRGRVLHDAFERNRIVRTNTDDVKYNLESVLDDLTAGKNGVSRFEAMFPAGKYTQEELKRAADGVRLLKLATFSTREGTNAPNYFARQREATINVISRSAEFFGRWVFGELEPMQVEKMLFSDEGVHALMQIGRFHGKDKLVIKTANEGAMRPVTLTQGVAAWSRHANNVLAEEAAMEQAQEKQRRLEELMKQSQQMGGVK